MTLSKEETYKQLLFQWLELFHSFPGEMKITASWALKLTAHVMKTAEALKGEPIPPLVTPPSGESRTEGSD